MSDDEEYVPAGFKSKKKKKKKSRKRKRNETLDPNQSTSKIGGSGVAGSSSTSISAAVVDGQPPKKRKKRGWSKEEEALFCRGLELHGRNWAKLSEFVGTNRNAAAMRSHAQIHFLRLLKQRKSLPAKVKESGDGYTLSGKPLNRHSSTVLKVFGDASQVPMDLGGVISDEEAANNAKLKNRSKKSKSKQQQRKRIKVRKQLYDSGSEDDDADADADADGKEPELMEVKQNIRRSKRIRTQNISCHALSIQLMNADPFGLRSDIELYSLSGIAQPFEVHYDCNALLLADLHAHLCTEVEIMGLLAGKYDGSTHVLRVLQCFPLNEEIQESQSVTADAADQLRVCMRISEANLEIVGWYHSHPCFDNFPSNTDLLQHNMYKKYLMGDESKNPFIGLIIASWSSMQCESHYRWFNTRNNLMPMQLHASAMTEAAVLPIHDQLFETLEGLVAHYSQSKYDRHRIDMGEQWHHSIQNCEKLFVSLLAHMTPSVGNQQLMKILFRAFKKQSTVWWLTNADADAQTDIETKLFKLESEQTQTQTQTQTHAEAEPKAQTHIQTEPQTEPNTEPNTEPTAKAKAETNDNQTNTQSNQVVDEVNTAPIDETNAIDATTEQNKENEN